MFNTSYILKEEAARININTHRLRTRVTTVVLLMLFTLSVNLSSASYADTELAAEEPKLRAAIALGILRFTRWPENVEFASSVMICTVGNPPSEVVLLRANAKYQYLDIPIVTERLGGQILDRKKCNALIIGPEASAGKLLTLFRNDARFGVLTICDRCQARSDAIMVTMVREKDRITFEVNLKPSRESGFSFSSSFLEIASAVRK